MKTLILVRHAKSDWSNHDLDDFERPLNKRGNKDAPLMGKIIKEKDIDAHLIISSPALRAKTTAEIIAKYLDYNPQQIQFEKKIYFGSYKNYLAIIRRTSNEVKNIYLFGHNPDITFLATYLSGKQFGNVPTTGMVCLNFDIKQWSEIDNNNGNLRFFEYPRMHKQ